MGRRVSTGSAKNDARPGVATRPRAPECAAHPPTEPDVQAPSAFEAISTPELFCVNAASLSLPTASRTHALELRGVQSTCPSSPSISSVGRKLRSRRDVRGPRDAASCVVPSRMCSGVSSLPTIIELSMNGWFRMSDLPEPILLRSSQSPASASRRIVRAVCSTGNVAPLEVLRDCAAS